MGLFPAFDSLHTRFPLPQTILSSVFAGLIVTHSFDFKELSGITQFNIGLPLVLQNIPDFFFITLTVAYISTCLTPAFLIKL